MLQIILIKYFNKKLINQHKILFHLNKPIVITNKKTHNKTHNKTHKKTNKKTHNKTNKIIFKV